MTELRALDPEPLGKGVVRLLENLCELASDGDVSSIAVAVVKRDGTTMAEWSDAPSVPALLGATLRLQRDLLGAGA